jgi:hypothetical protein
VQTHDQGREPDLWASVLIASSGEANAAGAKVLGVPRAARPTFAHRAEPSLQR